MAGGAPTVDARDFADWVRAATRALERHRAAIDALNVFPVPDGDTGTNLWLTMSACRREVEKAMGGDLGEVVEAAARGALVGARGNSGVILSELLRGFSRYIATLHRPVRLDGRSFAFALEQAVRAAYEAVSRPVEGTMLTVARVASERALQAARSPHASVNEVLAAALEGAREALRMTPDLLAALAQAGVVDAGGQGLVVLLEAARCVGAGGVYEHGVEPTAANPPAGRPLEPAAPGHERGPIRPTELPHRYCVEFLLQGAGISTAKLREALQTLGDSLLVVADASLVRCHVHTNHPDRALQAGLRLGALVSAWVSNMQEQNRAAAARTTPPKPATASGPAAACGVVAVASGVGLAEIFRSLGADRVVDGGGTMSPGVEALTAAVQSIPAPSVVVLPNHPNAVQAAHQARRRLSRLRKPLSKRVLVVPTRSVPQGLAAMLAFRPDLGPEANAAAMERAAKRIASGRVTRAPGDGRMGSPAAHAGDWVGMAEEQVVFAGPDLAEVLRQAATRLLDGGRTLLTLYYGQEVTAEQAEQLAAALRQAYAGVQVEVHYGGQPLDAFWLSAE